MHRESPAAEKANITAYRYRPRRDDEEQKNNELLFYTSPLPI